MIFPHGPFIITLEYPPPPQNKKKKTILIKQAPTVEGLQALPLAQENKDLGLALHFSAALANTRTLNPKP